MTGPALYNSPLWVLDRPEEFKDGVGGVRRRTEVSADDSRGRVAPMVEVAKSGICKHIPYGSSDADPIPDECDAMKF